MSTHRHLFALLLILGHCLPSVGQLTAWAKLPADTFVKGPTSGQFIQPANGRQVPFVNQQPLQGFSAIIRGQGDAFLAMTDNGFGAQGNSADYLLQVYTVKPRMKTASGGPGTLDVSVAFTLKDPDRKIPFPIVADQATYPGDLAIPVDARIRKERLLTGADFDIESFRQLADGSFYFGDEFGPFLLHTDADGKLLEAPIPVPGLFAPQHPQKGTQAANVPGSGGFEGMAIEPSGTKLYPMLEKPLEGQGKQLNIYEFDLLTRSFSHYDPLRPPYRYRLDEDAAAIGDFTALSDYEFLVIERDDMQGPDAKFKKIFYIDLYKRDPEGFLEKKEVLDLLHIPDPDNIGGLGTGAFSFPFVTIEGLVVIDAQTIGIANDNNYPFSVGRHTDTGAPDDTEFIWVRIPSWPR